MSFSQSRPWRITGQGGLALLILSAHMALVWGILTSSVVRLSRVPTALTVALLPRNRSASPALSVEPSVVIPHVATMPRPEVDIPNATPMTASVAPVPPPPVVAPAASTTLPQSTPADPPTLSQIAYLREPSPHYPPAARFAREEGLVVLRVIIDENGHVQNIAIHRSSGHPRLDEAAREAVSKALFKPYVSAGVARAAVAMIPIEFSLHGASS